VAPKAPQRPLPDPALRLRSYRQGDEVARVVGEAEVGERGLKLAPLPLAAEDPVGEPGDDQVALDQSEVALEAREHRHLPAPVAPRVGQQTLKDRLGLRLLVAVDRDLDAPAATAGRPWPEAEVAARKPPCCPDDLGPRAVVAVKQHGSSARVRLGEAQEPLRRRL
jgi:hypothetical protein